MAVSAKRLAVLNVPKLGTYAGFGPAGYAVAFDQGGKLGLVVNFQIILATAPEATTISRLDGIYPLLIFTQLPDLDVEPINPPTPIASQFSTPATRESEIGMRRPIGSVFLCNLSLLAFWLPVTCRPMIRALGAAERKPCLLGFGDADNALRPRPMRHAGRVPNARQFVRTPIQRLTAQDAGGVRSSH
jgi:hypothetical protein